MTLRRQFLLLTLGLLLPALGGALTALLPRLLRERERQEVERRTASVVVAMRDLARLETAEYHLERIIDLREVERRLYGLIEGEDALLLVAAGDVGAGVDLGQLGDGDVQLDAQTGRVRLRLPPPQIFRATLDEKRTYVHTRRTDLFATRNERLEGRAREIAAEAFGKAAREAGILGRAQAQAERVLRAMLRELGFREVLIEWR